MSVNIFNKSENKIVQVAGNTNWGGGKYGFQSRYWSILFKKSSTVF